MKTAQKTARKAEKSSKISGKSEKSGPTKEAVVKGDSQPTKKGKSSLGDVVTPLDDRLLVQVQEMERVTAGGIIIPDTSSVSGNQKAVVLAVGRGHLDDKGRVRPLELKVGDIVLLPEHSGDELRVLGQDVKILRESEVLGVIVA